MWLVPYLVTPACDCSRLSELACDFRVPLVPGDRDHDYTSAAYDYFAMLDTIQMILGLPSVDRLLQIIDTASRCPMAAQKPYPLIWNSRLPSHQWQVGSD